MNYESFQEYWSMANKQKERGQLPIHTVAHLKSYNINIQV